MWPALGPRRPQAPLEDELAAAVALEEVRGRGRDTGAGPPQEREVVRQPAEVVAADAARRLQRVEPGVREERGRGRAVERVHTAPGMSRMEVHADVEGMGGPWISSEVTPAVCPSGQGAERAPERRREVGEGRGRRGDGPGEVEEAVEEAAVAAVLHPGAGGGRLSA